MEAADEAQRAKKGRRSSGTTSASTGRSLGACSTGSSARQLEQQAERAERVRLQRLAAAAPPITAEEAMRQAEAEVLTLLLKADNNSGFRGVGFRGR